MIKIHYINEDFLNTRLDRWFRKNISNIPQSLLEKSIRKGKIKVNGKKRKSSYKLQLSDKIIIDSFSPKENLNKKSLRKYKPTKQDISYSSSIFIEDNENFAVINKPAGIAVQSGTKSRKNIMDIISETKEFEGFKPYTVHRIDKETTGILIIAKNRKYAQLFTSLFRIRKIHKTYLGIAIGEMQEKKGSLIDDLFHYEGYKKIKTKAITHYQVLDTNNNYSLLKLNPETGRKHQLRKQLLIKGCPILGDDKYRISNNKFNTKNKLMLHAYKINFSIAKLKYSFIAELPSDFKTTLHEKYLKILS
jgi:23S rRNA pseudouridine955/2504/2580 synthase